LSHLVEEPLRGRRVEDGDRRAADRLYGRERDDSGDAELVLGASRGDADRVADREVLLVGSAVVDRNLVRTVRPRAGLQRERVETLVAVRVDAGGDVRGAAGRDRLAVLVDQPRLVVADGALGVRDVRK